MLRMHQYGGIEYRLGDLYYGRLEKRRIPVEAIFCEKWSKTIGCEYARTKKSIRDFATLNKLVKNRTVKKPQNCSLLIHLRLGDVLDWDLYSKKFKCSIEKGCLWVHPISKYGSNIIPKTICKIEILGNPFYRVSNATTSFRYLQQVYDRVKHLRPSRVLIGKNADLEFLYMCIAKFFMPSKGKFSTMISEVVKYNGGKVVR